MKEDGGMAFPDPGRAQSAKQRKTLTNVGISVRDYFAAKALPEAMRQTASLSGLAVMPEPRGNAARIAYEIADAMLKERNK